MLGLLSRLRIIYGELEALLGLRSYLIDYARVARADRECCWPSSKTRTRLWPS